MRIIYRRFSFKYNFDWSTTIHYPCVLKLFIDLLLKSQLIKVDSPENCAVGKVFNHYQDAEQ